MNHRPPLPTAVRVHSPSGNHRCQDLLNFPHHRLQLALMAPYPTLSPLTSCPLSFTCRSSPSVFGSPASSTLHTDAGKLFTQQVKSPQQLQREYRESSHPAAEPSVRTAQCRSGFCRTQALCWLFSFLSGRLCFTRPQSHLSPAGWVEGPPPHPDSLPWLPSICRFSHI